MRAMFQFEVHGHLIRSYLHCGLEKLMSVLRCSYHDTYVVICGHRNANLHLWTRGRGLKTSEINALLEIRI